MNETESSHICTKCLFTGVPKISIGRLFIDFIFNLIFYTNVSFFQKVRHCPECGSHSMVLITSETGQIALAELKNESIGKSEKNLCDLCGETLSVADSFQDTQLCESCHKMVFEQQSRYERNTDDEPMPNQKNAPDLKPVR